MCVGISGSNTGGNCERRELGKNREREEEMEQGDGAGAGEQLAGRAQDEWGGRGGG